MSPEQTPDPIKSQSKAKEVAPLSKETDEIIKKIYEPTGPKPKSRDKIEKIIRESPLSPWLDKTELTKEDKFIQEELNKLKKEEIERRSKNLARQSPNKNKTTH
jgi:hypothetical protein